MSNLESTSYDEIISGASKCFILPPQKTQAYNLQIVHSSVLKKDNFPQIL